MPVWDVINNKVVTTSWRVFFRPLGFHDPNPPMPLYVTTTVVPGTAALTITRPAPPLLATVRPAARSLSTTASSGALKSTLVVASRALALATSTPVLVRIILPGAAALATTRSAPSLLAAVRPGARSLATAASSGALKSTLAPASRSLSSSMARASLKLILLPAAAALVLTASTPDVDIGSIHPPRAVSITACCPPDATLPPSMLPPPPRSASFAGVPKVDAASPPPAPLPPLIARSGRALVRAGIRAALLNRTAAADRVHLNPSEAWSREMFPAIGLHYVSDRGEIVSDAERQYLRTLELGVEVIVERRLGFEVGSNAVGDAIVFSESDELDDLCDQVERTLLADITLGGCAVDVRLVRTEMDFDDRGERVLGAARITFNVLYIEAVVERPVRLARDLANIHVDWEVPAPQSEPTASDDIALPMS